MDNAEKLYEKRIIEYLYACKDVTKFINYYKENYSDLNLKMNIVDVDKNFYKVSEYIKRCVSNEDYYDYLIFLHHFVKDVWQNGAKDLPHFTLHNELHSVELILIFEKLDKSLRGLLSGKLLSQRDMFILFCSIYLHDLGMLYFNYEDYYSDRNEYYQQCITNENLTSLQLLEEMKKYSTDIDKNRNVIQVYNSHKGNRSNYTRGNHAHYSSKFDSLFVKDIINDEIQDILDICENHYKDYSTINTTCVTKNYFDKRFVSLLLRIIDSMDQSIKRVSFNMFNFLDQIENINLDSLSHWAKHIMVDEISMSANNCNSVDLVIDFNSLGNLSTLKINTTIKSEYSLLNNKIILRQKQDVTTYLEYFIYDHFRYIFEGLELFENYLSVNFNKKITFEITIKNKSDIKFNTYVDKIIQYYNEK